MKAYITSLALGLFAAIFLGGCNDIFEAEIEKEKVVVLAPVDSVVIAGNKIHFSWEAIRGASLYHLQIAQPSFANATKIVVDTLSPLTSFSTNLREGWYEWRIRAENSVYATEYAYSTFKVDTSSNIEDYQVVLLAPADKFNTKSSEFIFKWEALELADFYFFTLNSADTNIMVKTQGTLLEVKLDSRDSELNWQIYAIQQEKNRLAHSEVRSLTIDNTHPAVPAILKPLSDASYSTNLAIAFEWEAATDKDFKEYIISIYRTGSTNPIVSPMRLSETSIQLFGTGQSKLPIGTYLWEIQTVDKLGNISPVGARLRSFTVTE